MRNLDFNVADSYTLTVRYAGLVLTLGAAWTLATLDQGCSLEWKGKFPDASTTLVASDAAIDTGFEDAPTDQTSTDTGDADASSNIYFRDDFERGSLAGQWTEVVGNVALASEGGDSGTNRYLVVKGTTGQNYLGIDLASLAGGVGPAIANASLGYCEVSIRPIAHGSAPENTYRLVLLERKFIGGSTRFLFSGPSMLSAIVGEISLSDGGINYPQGTLNALRLNRWTRVRLTLAGAVAASGTATLAMFDPELPLGNRTLTIDNIPAGAGTLYIGPRDSGGLSGYEFHFDNVVCARAK